MMLPNIAPSVVAKAKLVWQETIASYGRPIELVNSDDTLRKTVRAFCKRPKIMGLYDRTQASYDQEKYMVLLDAREFPIGDAKPGKFMRAVWDEEEHLFISVTEVDLMGDVFGYRVLVKG